MRTNLDHIRIEMILLVRAHSQDANLISVVKEMADAFYQNNISNPIINHDMLDAKLFARYQLATMLEDTRKIFEQEYTNENWLIRLLHARAYRKGLKTLDLLMKVLQKEEGAYGQFN